MDESVYNAPKSDLNRAGQLEIPEDILKKIKHGWIAALISGVLTFGVMLLAISTGVMEELFDIWTTIDVVLIFLLAFGIYKKSRFAATFMFAYFLLSKILIMVETGQPNGLVLAIVFLYFYYNAMIATYKYRKLIDTHNKGV
jgi:hypothetical protein